MRSMIRTVLARAMLTLAVVGLMAAGGVSGAAERNTIEIASRTGVHLFSVEFVDNDKDRAQGLMYRKSLPEGQGMLFDFKKDQDVAFWMENTYISLDMIFIRGDGTIARIEQNTTPLSTRNIPSGGPVRGVLEVIAGTVKKLGIAPGDKVAHPIFAGR